MIHSHSLKKVIFLKVLIAYNYDPSCIRVGGGITYVHNLIKYLLDSGNEVLLFGVELSENRTFNHPNFKFIPVLKGTDNWWKFILHLNQAIKSTDVPESCLIHTHHPLVMYPFIHNLPKNPKVCTFHGITLDWVQVNYSYIYKLIRPIYTHIELKVINNVDIITTAGAYPKIGLESRYSGLDLSNKIIVIPSGVDLDKFKPMDKCKLRKKYGLDYYSNVILFLGRLSEQKNLNLLFRSFSLVQNTLENSVLVIVGRGELEEDLKQLVKKMALKNVVFTGEVKPEEVPELLNCADVFALTSWYEASPTVVKESLACGIPVISTKVGDVSDIITSPFLGCVVNSFEENVYAKALLETIELISSSLEDSSSKCREIALKHFSFDAIGNKFIEVYKKFNNI